MANGHGARFEHLMTTLTEYSYPFSFNVKNSGKLSLWDHKRLSSKTTSKHLFSKGQDSFFNAQEQEANAKDIMQQGVRVDERREGSGSKHTRRFDAKGQ